MVMAATAKVWTLEEVHSLPDDGNKYELIHGELYVTPPPTDSHETIAARLTRLLDPFVAAHDLGYVYRAKAVVRVRGSEVEPDLFVRQPHPDPEGDWDTAPIPILVVEIVSPSTRRRDYGPKKSFYMEIGVAEYWIVERERRAITVIRPGEPDRIEHERLTWTPPGVADGLTIDVGDVIGQSCGV